MALLGYGYAGRTFHAPLIRSVEGLELRVVGSSSENKVRADLPDVAVVPVQTAITARGVDLVVIATPSSTHHDLTEAALRAGRHVVVDKPFTITSGEARALAGLAKRAGRVLSVFHNRRFDSDFLGARDILASGRLGRVVHYESRFDRMRPLVQQRWRERSGRGSGVWLDLGPHLVDQALQLFGRPLAVSGDMAGLRPGAMTDDWAHVVLDFGEQRAVLSASMLVAGGTPRLALHGTQGSWLKNHGDVQEEQLRAGALPGSAGWGEDRDAAFLINAEGVPTAMPVPPGDYRRYYAALREAIAGIGPNPVPPEQAVDVMTVLEAALESSTTGRRVQPRWD